MVPNPTELLATQLLLEAQGGVRILAWDITRLRQQSVENLLAVINYMKQEEAKVWKLIRELKHEEEVARARKRNTIDGLIEELAEEFK